jgi:mRNA interferase MazF
MELGDVIITSFAQADGIKKYRPAIIVAVFPPFNDLLVSGVSTQVHQYVEGFDELILVNDEDFSRSGLQADSLIRMGYLVTISPRSVHGVIGAISQSRLDRLRYNLITFLDE